MDNSPVSIARHLDCMTRHTERFDDLLKLGDGQGRMQTLTKKLLRIVRLSLGVQRDKSFDLSIAFWAAQVSNKQQSAWTEHTESLSKECVACRQMMH